MSLVCPWCRDNLDTRFVAGLTKLPQPCPSCGNPVRESIWQVAFSVVLTMPIVAVTLYLSFVLGDQGHTYSAIVLFLCGGAIAILVQAYFPIVHGPAKGG